MLTKRDRTALQKAVEAVFKVRRENLHALMIRAGGWTELGKWTAQSAAFLVACAGPNPSRTIGEKLARSLEVNLGLKSGWLDQSH
jgi:hypothetical protein